MQLRKKILKSVLNCKNKQNTLPSGARRCDEGEERRQLPCVHDDACVARSKVSPVMVASLKEERGKERKRLKTFRQYRHEVWQKYIASHKGRW